MRALVTGGTGFIGSALARRLVALGNDVIITGNQTEQQVAVSKILEPGLLGIDWSQVNNIDVVFHQAANNDTLCDDREAMFQANVKASIYLFAKCLQAGCKDFVFASSTAVYGNEPAPYIEGKTRLAPLNHYADSKVSLESVAQDFGQRFGVKVVGLRYCNVYGPGEAHKGRRASMVFQMIRHMLTDGPPRLFRYGEQRRDYIHVDDVVEANLLAWKYERSDIFNCGAGEATAFIDVYHNIAEALGWENKPEPIWIDNPHAKTYQNYTECDMKKAESLLGFKPQISLPEGIKSYIKTLACRG